MTGQPNDDHGLDDLVSILDGLVDLDAGLEDVHVGDTHNQLLGALTATVDLEAGLAVIVPATPRSNAVPPAAHETRPTTLRAFADDLAARPPRDRLAARVWTPRLELADARSLTQLKLRISMVDLDLARARDVAHTRDIRARLVQCLAGDAVARLAAARAAYRDRERDLGVDPTLLQTCDLVRVYAIDLGLDVDLSESQRRGAAFTRALDTCQLLSLALQRSFDLAVEIARGAGPARVEPRSRAVTALFDEVLSRAHTMGIDVRRLSSVPRPRLRTLDEAVSTIRAIDVVRDAARDLVLATARELTRDLASALDIVRDATLDRASTWARTFAHPRAASLAAALTHDLDVRAEGFDIDVVYSVLRIEDAVTNLMGADLAHIGLHGIPLEGLRWSSATRWHTEWGEHVRRNSVEIKPDLYEIRGSAAGVDGMVTDVAT